MKDNTQEMLRNAAEQLRSGKAYQDDGIAGSRKRLKQAAQNESTVLALNQQNKDLRAALSERDRMLGEAASALRVYEESDGLTDGFVAREFLSAYDASKTAGKDGA